MIETIITLKPATSGPRNSRPASSAKPGARGQSKNGRQARRRHRQYAAMDASASFDRTLREHSTRRFREAVPKMSLARRHRARRRRGARRPESRRPARGDRPRPRRGARQYLRRGPRDRRRHPRASASPAARQTRKTGPAGLRLQRGRREPGLTPGRSNPSPRSATFGNARRANWNSKMAPDVRRLSRRNSRVDLSSYASDGRRVRAVRRPSPPRAALNLSRKEKADVRRWIPKSGPRLDQHLDPAHHQPHRHARHRRPHHDRRQTLRPDTATSTACRDRRRNR